MKSPLQVELCVSTMLAFLPENKFLDLAPVSRLFFSNYSSRVTQISEDTSSDNMVEYFENGMPMSEHLPSKAAELGRLDLFKLAVGRGCAISHRAVEVAARRGHVAILEYIWYRGSSCTQCACTGASVGGKLDVLRWLFPGNRWCHNQVDIGRMLVRNAVVRGHLPIVAWAHKKGQSLDNALIGTAVTYGHFEIVKYLHHNQAIRGELPLSAILHAALRGDSETLMWLRGKGYPWSEGVCTLLARKGNVDALRYARANGCPWGMLTIDSVRSVVDEDVLAFLVESNCPV